MAATTIADVARAAGVSKGLVSFALNDRPGVAPGTRDRILATADDLGWRPSVPARSLSTRTAYAVGLVIARRPELVAADPFYLPFIAGAEQALAVVGRTLVLSITDPGPAEHEVYRRLGEGRRVDGVFVSDLRPDDARLELLAQLGVPAVTIGATGDRRFPAVGVDDAVGVVATVAHLAALGHRRIAHVAGPPELVHGERRVQAFAAALRDAGVADGPVVRTDFSPAAAARATDALLGSDEPPTAIVYGNDAAAIAGLSVAQQRGLRIPDDLSISGFDDSEIARWVQPALTTVQTHPMLWGRRAAEVLLQHIDGRAPLATALEPARLVIRRSTGPAPH